MIKVIRATLIIDAVGFPKEKVKESLERIVKEISKNAKLESEKYGNIIQESNNVFSCHVEATFTFKSLKDLVFAVIDYGPRFVEILEPKEITIDLAELEEILNNFAMKMHDINETTLLLQSALVKLQRKVFALENKLKGKREKKENAKNAQS